MKPRVIDSNSPEARRALADLLEDVPLLVEVHFVRCGTGSDWYLCRTEEDLTALLKKLDVQARVELHIHSVWDLEDRKGGTVLHKGDYKSAGMIPED